MDVRDIQAAMKAAGVGIWDEFTAREIADALPFGALALGKSEADVLDTILKNRQNGAVERLVQAHRIYERDKSSD